MANWLQRYKVGEHAAVWEEMQLLGGDLSKPAYRRAADAVVRETMKRASANVQVLFQELLSLGYQFQGAPELVEPD